MSNEVLLNIIPFAGSGLAGYAIGLMDHTNTTILPSSDRQQYNKMMGLQQVAYQPPIGHKVPTKRCIYGICENTTNLTNETYV